MAEGGETCERRETQNPDVRFMVDAMRGEFDRLNRRFEEMDGRMVEMERNQRGERIQDENRGRNGVQFREQNRERDRNRRQNEREQMSNSSGEESEEIDENREFRRERNRRGRNRWVEVDDDMRDVRPMIPKFQGKNDPEAYLDWESRVVRSFECHRYSERKKLRLVVLEFTDYASSWWDKIIVERRKYGEDPIESWRELRILMRRRFVPSWYQREMYQRLEYLLHGARSVADYNQEMENLMIRLNIDEKTERSMARFLRGLNAEIREEVDRQHYVEYDELVQIAMKVKQSLQRKKDRFHMSSSSWKSKEGSKERFQSRNGNGKPKKSRDQNGKDFAEGNSRPRNIKCFKCQGRGHIAKVCPNKVNMTIKKGRIVTDSEQSDSKEETEEESDSREEELLETDNEEVLEGPIEGDTLMVRRMLNIQATGDESQRENIFHSRCFFHGKVCSLIIDGGSCTNVASTKMVEKLGLSTQIHPTPYALQGLNKAGDIKVNQQVLIPIKLGHYEDEILCDIVPMDAAHILLGRPWQFDMKVFHDGYYNKYMFEHRGKKITLTPMTLRQIHDDLQKMREREKNEKRIEKNTSIEVPTLSD
ncbi:PREDICTED: uncharacterized protein LOC109160611 [Ipomoea nil]|uniref:uncharacterized protein LOC109160611 n=1 Tax=Ipomoea nil TaxID=35883 RepID=UPI00090168FA|nr:PREDICTED: uncharacterized protein LOC109160611 [Ipomoea nil]